MLKLRFRGLRVDGPNSSRMLVERNRPLAVRLYRLLPQAIRERFASARIRFDRNNDRQCRREDIWSIRDNGVVDECPPPPQPPHTQRFESACFTLCLET